MATLPSNKSASSSPPPSVCRLAIEKRFNGLTEKEKLYAHHMARAAWHGTRIILRQVSPESNSIFDLIMELHACTKGNWQDLSARTGVPLNSLHEFLEYAASFLSNVGNYYKQGKGDQKFTPLISNEDLARLCSLSVKATRLYHETEGPTYARPPFGLGFPSEIAQSSYYPGTLRPSRDEIARISQALEETSIHPENTRIRKTLLDDGGSSFDVLQASVEIDDQPREIPCPNSGDRVRLIRGDHSRELEQICASLDEARKHAANPLQDRFILKYQESLRTGHLEPYRESQGVWVKDMNPSVETVFGFVEPYRDPFGVRAEYEGLVAVVDKEETKLLTALVENSAKFIRRLPWAKDARENDGKGPFEKTLFEPSDFTSLHGADFLKSIIFPGINLPNYNDIRENVGFKNMMISNSMASQSSKAKPTSACVHLSEVDKFFEHKIPTYYLWVVFHELLGHGTGKLLVQDGPDSFNFDLKHPPVNPLTGTAIESWYRPGQTWTGVFEDIATSVDECRAECVGAYLMSDRELLAMFGYTNKSVINADDCKILPPSKSTRARGVADQVEVEYNMYLQLGVAGLRALENYIVEDHKWGQAHSRAHFAMFRCLLAAGDDFMTIEHDTSAQLLTVHVDRAKIATHGRPAIGDLLLRLHIYRCTADVKNCRAFYESLTQPSEPFLEWRKMMLANQVPRQIFVQANTFLREDGRVVLKEYDTTFEGVIQSWAERAV
ncbi:MAG: hypothetical protein M1816_004491 [Peltula sp. TS41687]|nr:MAG: hypothetical protein M1816_004491 [Peltula sp. TS41687]